MKNNFPVLTEECKQAIKETIREDLHAEAETILLYTNDKNRKDFMKYYKEDNGNLCCLVLDFAKQALVKEGIMIQYNDDGFGKLL